MALDTGKGRPGEGKEENEKNQNSGIDPYEKIYKEYCENQFLDGNTKVDFINKMTQSSDFDSSLRNELFSYAEEHSEYFNSSIDKDKFNFIRLKRYMLSEITLLKRKRDNLKKTILRDYDISPEEYRTLLQGEVDKLTESELETYKKEESIRLIFLKRVLGKDNIPNTRNYLTFLNGFELGPVIDKKLKELEQHNPEKSGELRGVLAYFDDLHPVGPSFTRNLNFLMQGLIEFNIFTHEERNEIVDYFIPSMTLKQARELGFLSDAQIKNFIYAELIDNQLDDITKEKLCNSLFNKLDDIDIDTSIFSITSDADILSLVEKVGFNSFAQDLKNIESKINNEGPQSLTAFQYELSQKCKGKINGADNFKKGNTIQLKIQTSEKNDPELIYYHIASDGMKDGECNKSILLDQKGRGSFYNSEGKGHYSSDYNSLLNDYGNDKIVKSIEIFDTDTLKNKIKNGEILEESESISFKTNTDISNLKKRLKDELVEDLVEKGYIIADENGFPIEESPINYDSTDEELNEFYDSLSGESKEKYKGDFDKINSCEDYNYDYIKNKLDTLNSDGKKFGFDIGTTFETKKGEIYTIFDLNKTGSFVESLNPNQPGYLELEGITGNKEKMDFESFYDAFKSQETQRTSNITSPDDMVKDLQESITSWSGFKYENNQIKSTDKDTAEFDFNYLVSKDSKKFYGDFDILKIEAFGNDKVTVNLGKSKDGEKKTEDEGKIFYQTENETINVSYGILHSWIKKSTLEFKSIENENNVVEEDIEEIKRKSSLSSRFFSRLNMSELLAGGKLWLESIEQYLKEGNDEHAAQFASKLWLPKNLKRDLLTRVESAEKKRMDEYIEKLESVDSGPATRMIEDWLINKDSDEHKKHAALIFMSKKYGTLYAKDAIYKYKGKFLWYESFGGKVGDKLYREMKADAEAADVQFTEEALVYRLVAKQCKGDKGYNGIKRRSRLYKELEALIGKGKDEEREKGQKDAKKKRTVTARVKHALGELEGGSYPNAMGALEEVINKGDDGNITTLDTVPFVMLFSGVGYNFDQDMCDKFKNLPGTGKFVMSTMFLSNVSKMNIYNDTVLQLSKDLSSELGGRYSKMGDKAQEIFNNQKKGLDETKKIKKATEFFEEYGDAISRSMNFLNTGQTDELSYFENWIKFKQNDEGKSVYKRYANLFHGLTGQAEFNKDDELNADAFNSDVGPGGASGMNMHKVVLQNLAPVSGGVGFRMQKSGPMFWREIQKQFDATLHMKFVKNGEEQDIEKDIQMRIEDDVRGLFGGLLEIYGGRDKGMTEIIETSTGQYYHTFKKWGLKSENFKGLNYNHFLEGKDQKCNDLVKEIANNIIKGSSGKDDVFSFSDHVSNVTNETLKNS